MRRRITLLVVTALTAAAMTVVGGAGAAFADNPHAGKSGHFKGSVKQCDRDHPKCPPFGG